jgi:hypothetical protein
MRKKSRLPTLTSILSDVLIVFLKSLVLFPLTETDPWKINLRISLFDFSG